MTTPDTNLTGVWHGTYAYPFGQSVSFTAVLIESTSHLSGTTHEACSVPGCPVATHDAFLLGRRAGSAVTFTKTYEPMGNGYGTVQYEGTLNADSSEIHGRWSLPLFSSGQFVMIRSPGAKETVSEKKFEQA